MGNKKVHINECQYGLMLEYYGIPNNIIPKMINDVIHQ